MCRGRAGPEKSASVLQGSRSQGTRWKASCQLVSMLGFCTKCQCFSLICFALHRVGLQHFGRCRFRQIWLPFVFCRRFRTGCPGSGLLLLEARRSGYCVRACGGVKGINPGFLVLGFSTRTLKSRGGSGKTSSGRGFCVGMLSLVCSTPACRRAFSCGPSLLRFGVRLSSQDLLVGKLPPLCWLAALRGVGGAFGAGSWLLQVSRKSGCPSCFTGCWCWQ